MTADQQPTQPTRPTLAPIAHADVEAVAAWERADAAQGESEDRRRARQRAHERLRADVPASLLPYSHLSVSRDGSITQQFSGARAGDCGCGKPDFSQIKEAAVVNLIPHTPSASAPMSRGGRFNPDDRARALRARVETSRAAFASTATPAVLFDAQGAVIGTADPKNITKVDGKKVVACFDQHGQLLGFTSGKNITAVDPGKPAPGQGAQPTQQPQQASLQAGGGKLSPAQRWW
jgi:hypothetical protein